MPKFARQALIREIVRQAPVKSQQALRRALAQRGMTADQATISRDLREIGVAKTSQGYVLPGETPPRPGYRTTALRLEHVYAVSVAGNLVVLKTPPGLASPTAIEIDRVGHPDLAGSLAGDDTVFLAARTPRAAQLLARLISKGLHS